MASLILAGLGNTGLPLADHVARMKDVRSVILVDPDDFTRANVAGQPISPSCAGAAKVEVAAARMKEINRALDIESWKCRLEHLPRGLFRNKIVISGLDTRWARAELSGICLATGADLWLDMGVRPDGRIARVSIVFPSAAESACLCCGWSQKDWDAISAEFSCDGTATGAPTRSPAYLGAAAGAMAAHLLERHLAGHLARLGEVQHHIMSLESHKTWITRVPRGATCRSSHQRWNIAQLGATAAACTLRDLALEKETLALPGLPFVGRLRCGCDAGRPLLYVAARLDARQMRCSQCGQPMHYGAMDLMDEINLSALEEFGPETPALALAGIGIRDGDIIRLRDRYFEVGASARSM